MSCQILALVPADDRKAMRTILGDVPPAKEGVANYITDLEERCVLFDQLQQRHRQGRLAPTWPSTSAPAPTTATPRPEEEKLLTGRRRLHLR